MRSRCEGCDRNKDGDCSAKWAVPGNAARLLQGVLVTYCPMFKRGSFQSVQETVGGKDSPFK